MKYNKNRIKTITWDPAILKDCPINVIGEALAKLDPETEIIHMGTTPNSTGELVWTLTNPKYDEVVAGDVIPEISIIFERLPFGQVAVKEVEEFPVTPAQAAMAAAQKAINTQAPLPKMPSTQHVGIDFSTPKIELEKASDEEACRCGLEAAGVGGRHATYCPKYEEFK